MDIDCTVGLVALGLGITGMFLGYKAKFEKGRILLEKNDKEHEKKHHANEERIKELEKKNGHEQRQIDEVKADLATEKKEKSELKDLVIKLQNRIINCEKTNGNKNKEKSNTTPSFPNQTTNQPKPKPTKSHNETLKEALEKRRRDLEGEDD